MTSIPPPSLGAIIRYEYLWLNEFGQGMENGAKDRPCLVLAIKTGDTTCVLPITHTQPHNTAYAVEIPSKTKARLGLDDQPSWIICSELNEFEWPGPDIRKVPNKNTYMYGFIPPKLFEQVKTKYILAARSKRFRVVSRTA